MAAAAKPNPTPRYAKPAMPVLKWYTVANSSEKSFGTARIGHKDWPRRTWECSEHQVIDAWSTKESVSFNNKFHFVVTDHMS